MLLYVIKVSHPHSIMAMFSPSPSKNLNFNKLQNFL